MKRGDAKHRLRAAGPWPALAALLLRGLRSGELTVAMPDGSEHVFRGPAKGCTARIELVDMTFPRRLLLGGSIALAEGYMDGAWRTEDLDSVLALGLHNLDAGWSSAVPALMRPIERVRHALRDNDEDGGSRRNVAAHYDLGNDFYELWLDDSLTYSAACLPEEAGGIPTPEQLEHGQVRKWDRVLELIQPATGDHLLEIGCGWGGFAIHAAKEAGCRVTGVTLSEEQARHASKRVAEEGLDGQVEIRLQDYRNIGGSYDGIASIEMFEAVGERWWPVFFGRVRELLAPGSVASLQTITISENAFEQYRSDPDFIQRYIFPGGMLPSPERFRRAAEHAGLAMGEPYFFGHDYARTLAAWAARFESVLPQVRSLGFDDRFIRMWRYYLSYCRTGFEHGMIDVMQVRLEDLGRVQAYAAAPRGGRS